MHGMSSSGGLTTTASFPSFIHSFIPQVPYHGRAPSFFFPHFTHSLTHSLAHSPTRPLPHPNFLDPPLAALFSPRAFFPGPMSSRWPARSPSRRSVLFVMPAASLRCSLSAALPFFDFMTRAPFFVLGGCGLLARPVDAGLLPVFFGAPCAISFSSWWGSG
ncbi:hypothetical protein F4801DRAFT_118662 [Xylaria longipes]|nr:hypothetical protein F4801DRAFT_118662 [Xylaria longipes]